MLPFLLGGLVVSAGVAALLASMREEEAREDHAQAREQLAQAQASATRQVQQAHEAALQRQQQAVQHARQQALQRAVQQAAQALALCQQRHQPLLAHASQLNRALCDVDRLEHQLGQAAQAACALERARLQQQKRALRPRLQQSERQLLQAHRHHTDLLQQARQIGADPGLCWGRG